jgi:hypothetical protein
VARHVAALHAHGIEPDVVLAHEPRPDPNLAPATGAPGRLPAAIEGGRRARLVTADLARPQGVAHDPVKLGASLAALVRSP